MKRNIVHIKSADDFKKIKQQETFDCECEKCGHIIEESEEHCEDITCPKCGGNMREIGTDHE